MNEFTYNSNPLLKKTGASVSYTKEQVEELIKCKEDPIYFIENYCKIVSLDHEDPILFSLFEYQKNFIKSMHENRRLISMQPRQMGKTSVVAGYICWYVGFQSNQTVAILANKGDVAQEVLTRVKFMYEHLPTWMQHGIKKWNEKSIVLENGSKIITAATTKSGLRSRSCNFLYIDEAAIIPNNIAEEFFTAIYPIISAGKKTKIILTSTPKGYNHFWKYWNEAITNKNGFSYLEVKYYEHPQRDEAWAREQRQLLGELAFQQEVLCSFIGSSLTLISGDTLSRLSFVEYVYQKNEVDFIEYPEKDHIYFIPVDTSEGVGGDYSAFSVVDITKFPYRVVAKFRSNKINYLFYPNIIHQIAKMYFDAFVLVEINSIGNQVAHILHDDLEYENLMMVSQETKKGQYLSLENKANFGVKTTKQVKRIGCQTLKTLIEDNKLLVTDKDIINEFTTFIETKGSYAADTTYHDDLVMTLVLFAWATQDNMFKDIINTDTRKAIIERREKEMEDFILPVGYLNDGLEEDEEILSFF